MRRILCCLCICSVLLLTLFLASPTGTQRPPYSRMLIATQPTAIPGFISSSPGMLLPCRIPLNADVIQDLFNKWQAARRAASVCFPILVPSTL